MTAPRRNWNQPPRRAFACCVLALGLVLAITSWVRAATTERIVVDPRTGLAIGRGELELSYGGVVWRFRNAGNRIAFTQDPEVYMPQFGGYDPVMLGQGVATPGHPQLWVIVADRLYLFSTREDRETFAAAPDRAAAAARINWPRIAHGLVP
jgi:YHS domain-containing protein